VRYYVMTRPLGWWGPVHAEALRRGLIAAREASPPAPRARPLIRRRWTADEAQEWTREDWIAIVLSPVVYGCVLFGLVRLLLSQPSGGLLLVAAALGAWIVYWVIDPKLRAVSVDYEQRQADYTAELARKMRWDRDG
jgi:hypothetical protein